MKESYRKGLASRPGPESCVNSRKAAIEALTGGRAGRVLSCEIIATGVPTSFSMAEGRHASENRKWRGEDKPETFDFPGFTHMCGQTRKTGRFIVKRKTIRKRLSAKLKELKEELRRPWHEPVAEVGKWLRSVVRGYFNYHAVPGNMDGLNSFRAQVIWRWYRALRRHSSEVVCSNPARTDLCGGAWATSVPTATKTGCASARCVGQLPEHRESEAGRSFLLPQRQRRHAESG